MRQTLVLIVLAIVLVQPAISSAGSVPPPIVEGPVAGAPSLDLGRYPLSSVGYSATEYFFSGTATAYDNASRPNANGRWRIKPVATAPYKSRIVVVAPTDPSRFGGTVVFEWLNESAGVDGAAEWGFGHDEMIRSGDIYVGVSAQALGINQLVSSDPERYSSLNHPGNSFAYDIFSQAAEAFRTQSSTLIPGFSKPTLLIGSGESQSAIYLTTYIDAIAPVAREYDGYLIHSRSGLSGPLSVSPQRNVLAPFNMQIRTDLKVPVLTFLTETDVLGVLYTYGAAKQRDSRYFRIWEVPGTAHADAYATSVAQDDDTSLAADQSLFAALTSPPSSVSVVNLNFTCPAPLNAGEHHYVYQTALRTLVNWIKTEVPPPSMPRFAINSRGRRPSYALDKNGNVKGGIRTPSVDAPLAVLSGLPAKQVASPLCIFFGHTTPFTPEQIQALYPTHDVFVSKWHAAVQQDQDAGYLLPEDAERLDAVVQ
jgi:hypothetical protein